MNALLERIRQPELAKDEVRRHNVLNIPHVRQRHNWDCGVACVRMILSYLDHPVSQERIMGAIGTSSVWTIDLAYALRQFVPDLEFIYGTITIGVEESYSDYSFYKKEFETDTVRVNHRFSNAGANGITIEKVRLESSGLANMLLSGIVAVIVLVDLRFIPNSYYHLCGKHWPYYTGHYIVLCGYSSDADEYTFSDPARQAGTGRRIKAPALEKARLSAGTDEDFIAIVVPQHQTAKTSESDDKDMDQSVNRNAPLSFLSSLVSAMTCAATTTTISACDTTAGGDDDNHLHYSHESESESHTRPLVSEVVQ
mmetsp:Transcript_34490/g.46615  ORF Transcript_34490/g.46615 Transcript_34490/m.46615 type:complete len:311 (-) Transcript_34490:311-1243(-)|eukprot:CAMPEP_0185797790 /NCGR_PEP_ID=MMETSP1174-20130828/161804_1 /TAXON_ID=35687 /ORGANISM="Dictyocha speculum, Strain CCMP1381" /LENGTH=310 /DNA_ID=CAMNT_0028493251 /DNA_START=137 /DNA_END=1069 /DNA_ORIENTATION=+